MKQSITLNSIYDMQNIFDQCSDEELQKLNQMLIRTIEARRSFQARFKIMEFNIGDLVYFINGSWVKVTGIIVRKNKKSVSIASKEHWERRVAPNLVHKA